MFRIARLPRLQGHLHLDAIVAAATLANALAVAALVVWPTRWAAVPVLVVTGASWVWATVAFTIAARQVDSGLGSNPFPVALLRRATRAFVAGGLGFGVIDTFLPLRETLAVAALTFIPGIL